MGGPSCTSPFHEEINAVDILLRALSATIISSSPDCRYGFIVCVLSMEIGEGRILPGRGDVLFPIQYQAIVFKPFKVRTRGSVMRMLLNIDRTR